MVPHVNLSKASGRNDSQSPQNLGARVLITYCIEIWFAIDAHAGVWSKQRNNGGREQWGKSVVVYISTLTTGFSGRVFFFFFFLGLAFWVGFLNRLTLEQETNGDGVDGMGCHGCVALVLCRTKMKLSKDTLSLGIDITNLALKCWANVRVYIIRYCTCPAK